MAVSYESKAAAPAAAIAASSVSSHGGAAITSVAVKRSGTGMQRASIRTNARREEDVFSTTDALAVAVASRGKHNARDSRYALLL